MPADFTRTMQGCRCGSGTFRMNVALSELPNFTCLPGPRVRLTTRPASSSRRRCDYMDRPTSTRARQGWSKRADRRDADSFDARRQPRPAGPACRQPVLPALRADVARWRVWDVHREAVADLMIETVESNMRPTSRQRYSVARSSPARSRTHVRPRRRRHLSRRADARPAVLGAPDARPRRLSQAHDRALHVRRGHASRRRRDRRAGAQCSARNRA